MEEDLISKKELLELTGISYGALYRYKRKGLIPDEWFIRKSTFTGQETFFPRDLIIERIIQIQELKENVSLDDMSEILSDSVSMDIAVDRRTLLQKLSPPMCELVNACGDEPVLHFTELLAIETADTALRSGLAAVTECEQILQTMLSFRAPQKGDRLLCYRLSGVFFCMAVNGEIHVDSSIKLIMELHLDECIIGLKKYRKEGKENE